MEQLLIEVGSQNTSFAIKEFVGRFADASISIQDLTNDDNYYEETYGLDKATFENRLNIGVAQSVLGITKTWEEVKAELTVQISNR